MIKASDTVKVSLSSSGISLMVSLLFAVLSGKLEELHTWFLIFSIVFGIVSVVGLVVSIVSYLNDE